MEPKTPATALRRSQRKVVVEKQNGGGPPKEEAKILPKEEAAATPDQPAGRGEETADAPCRARKRGADGAGQRGSATSKKRKEAARTGDENQGGDEQIEEELEAETKDDGVVEEPKTMVKKAEGRKKEAKKAANKSGEDGICRFLGEPFSQEEAKKRWPHRYKGSRQNKGSCAISEVVDAIRHYGKAQLDDSIYDLYDDVYVKAGEGEPHYIGRIIELFESTDKECYFTAQWYFRADDTVIKEHGKTHDQRRVFLSEEKNDNILDCVVSKVKIVQVAPNIDLKTKMKSIPPCDLYYDMSYSPSYATFSDLSGNKMNGSETSSSTICSEENAVCERDSQSCLGSNFRFKSTASLLDLYSGCGAMSTGLCIGAQLSGMNLETRWAVDFNKYACESLKLNHPNVEVRNEKAEDFLELLKEWEKLCRKFFISSENSHLDEKETCMDDGDCHEVDSLVPSNEFEVGKLVGICYGDPCNTGKIGLKFKVRWKGYGPNDDTWEPVDGLIKCNERIEDFVRSGHKSCILPLPGLVDVICGGPPCQGISGFNRFRNFNAPLNDAKNLQMKVFMDIVDFLKPKYVLMENVVDILKFAGGYLGRYAISRLVMMNYQTRLGMMVAGSYGLPQFRMRAFLWAACPSEHLPQFPLPTHNVILRGICPNEFEHCIVAYDEGQPRKLEEALLLSDAISDLPPVTNNEERDEMSYGALPKTNFQQHIRAKNLETSGSSNLETCASGKSKLYDHRPLKLNQDDYDRVCQIPKEKGANFRNLPGVRVREDKIVEWDPDVPRVYLASGKPLVPDYAMSFVNGKSCKPFGRLWWNETVPTVVTRAEPHNQAILHPVQDRVLTIRENARLQGFPDYYKLLGPIKERYIQVGNAVAVPVARALGYALGMAFQGNCGDHCLLKLPQGFPQHDDMTSATASKNGISS